MTLIDQPYAPPRDFISKVRRRATQARAARPATLAFDEPVLSVCFDDFPRSAALEGARILERHGARGTFYASAGMSGVDGPCGPGFAPQDLPRLLSLGHEIGCHTFSHRDCARTSAFDTLTDLAKNRDALSQMGVRSQLATLAYPYGETSRMLKLALPPRFETARGVLPGLNVGRVDLTQLRAYGYFGEGIARANSALKRAARRRAWMIVFTHDIAQTPSPWGTSPADLDALLTKARGLGFSIQPVSAALARAQ